MPDIEVTPPLAAFFADWLDKRPEMTAERIRGDGGPSAPTLRKLRQSGEVIAPASAARLEKLIGLQPGNLAEISRGDRPRYLVGGENGSPPYRPDAPTELGRSLETAAELLQSAADRRDEGDELGSVQMETAAVALFADIVRRLGDERTADVRALVQDAMFGVIARLREGHGGTLE